MKRDVNFHSDAWDDLQYWRETHPKTAARILKLVEEARRDPSKGTGRPERLCGDLSGCWSRRIDNKNRLVYTVKDNTLVVLQARYHYDDH